MRDKPILFSAPMIRALLDGRKSQTRRALKLPTKTFSGGPIYERRDMGGWEPTTSGGGGCFTIGKAGERIPAPERTAIWHRTTGVCMEVPIQAGDRLWARETWQACEACSGVSFAATVNKPKNCTHCDASLGKWCPSIFMPRWASRLTLIVTDVRVQRLNEISEEDAIAEGLDRDCGDGCCWRNPADAALTTYFSAREAYGALWNSINGPGAWEANPWVAAYTFTVHKANIDALERALAEPAP